MTNICKARYFSNLRLYLNVGCYSGPPKGNLSLPLKIRLDLKVLTVTNALALYLRCVSGEENRFVMLSPVRTVLGTFQDIAGFC